MQFATTSNASPVTPGKFKIAVAQESPQSIREFTKQIQVRDQTECKETFKAIKNATTDAEKNAILTKRLNTYAKGSRGRERVSRKGIISKTRNSGLSKKKSFAQKRRKMVRQKRYKPTWICIL